jgi:PhnB protein
MASQAKPSASFMRPGFHTITPYLVIPRAAQLIEFLKRSFGATERLRVPIADGSDLIMHAEVSIGNSIVELADANDAFPPAPTAIHLYLDDADAAYDRAMQTGATSIYPPADQPWGDHQGAVKDGSGNIWYIAKPGSWQLDHPGELLTVQPYLHLKAADKMIPFLENAFGAEAQGVAKSSEGVVLHATIRIGNATLEIDEAHDDFQPMPCHLHLYVPNTDTAYQRALGAGATSQEAPTTKDYGDRSAGVKDPWGNSWFLATHLGPAGSAP